MDAQEEIIELLKKLTGLSEIKLEVPPDPKLGDYAFPCFQASKTLKKNPIEIAKGLAEKITPKGIIKEIRVSGPYLNFFVNKGAVASDLLKTILKQKDNYGAKKKNKKIALIESPGPNTNKPLHLGHVRNMVLGQALCNIFEAAGFTAYPVNINNDRGVHICKSMLAYQRWGKDDSPEKSHMKSDFFVGKYYVLFAKKEQEHPDLEKQALEMLEKWEQGDKEVRALWKKMNKWAFDGFAETYKTFGLKFKKEYFESETYQQGKEVVLDGLKKGLFEKNENNAVVADLEKEGFGKKVLLRPNGTTVYVTQDIFVAKQRYEDFKFDKLVYVVATEQIHHFKVLFTLLHKLGFKFADRCYHYAYGMVNLTSGKMKSREGNVVDADDLVKEMTSIAYEETKKRHPTLDEKELNGRAFKIAMAAIRFYLLKYEGMKDITFDPKESLSFEGETGPYVQYAYARIQSILKNAAIPKKANLELLNSESEGKLIMLLGNYPAIAEESYASYKPHLIARYALELAQSFNEFYHNSPVLQADEEIKKARLCLIAAVAQVLKNSLSLLKIEVLEEM